MSYPAKKLGEVCEIATGTTPKTSIKKYYGGHILWAGPADLDRGMYVTDTFKKLTKEGVEDGGARLVPKDSVMVSCIGYIGKIAIASEAMATNQQINTFTPKSRELDSKYLYHALVFKADDFKRLSSQTTLPIINKSKCASIEIPLPPLAEQKKIVERIEKQFAKIDEAIRLREQSLAASDAPLPATLHEIFEEGKQKGWPEEALGDICEIARGGSPRPIQAYLTEAEDGINWVKISDATNSEKYIFETKQKIKKDGLKKTREVKPGDFILTNSMSFGRPYIMKTTGAIHDGWLLLRPKKELLEEYMYYFLSSDEIYAQFKQLAGGAVVQNLNSELVRSVKIAIPPLAEQKRIVKKLDTLSEQIRQLRHHQTTQLANLRALKQSILHKTFKGG